jgi:hypothetical protein
MRGTNGWKAVTVADMPLTDLAIWKLVKEVIIDGKYDRY